MRERLLILVLLVEHGNDRRKVGPVLGLLVPALLHQLRVPLRAVRGDVWPELLLAHSQSDLDRVHALEGQPARVDFPHDHRERVHVGLFSVWTARQDFGRDPLPAVEEGSRPTATLAVLEARPAKVRNLHATAVIEHEVLRLEVAVQHGWPERVQVVHATRDVAREAQHLGAREQLGLGGVRRAVGRVGGLV
eukprot:CAMPEP_0119425642 /NCGR_PEP_ID=MMETSP1335-20130426/34843_1 /TAXON_ID=259385 /ORGANISM="Chrysoculter rhomboideus, Strain RCC1486" /LENGTH=191 /DNA_ID=CAMNT_0007451215 /DNA_START=73 /DNA_END=645 /DNA_ORIENTATION=-